MLALALTTGCAVQRQHEAMRVLGDIAAGAADSSLKRSTGMPSRMPVRYTVEGRTRSGDLYLPAGEAPRAAMVLVPGAVPEGKDDARLVELAHTLARARFAVLTPDMPGYRRLKVQPGDIREVADAVRYLSSRGDLAPGGETGIGAFSYALGPAVLAALEDDTRERVRFILGIGGYHDLRNAIRFFTTGFYTHRGSRHRLQASAYGKLVFARSVMDHLDSAHERAVLEAMIEARLRDPSADIAPLAARLGPQGRSVHALLENADPDRTVALIGELPAPSQRTIAALSLHDKDLSRLRAKLILIHGRNDLLIPFPESLALGEAVAPGQARVFILNSILGHVDLSLSHVLTLRFWTRELPDAWRLLRATALLLRQRDAPPGGHAAAAACGAPRVTQAGRAAAPQICR